MYHRQYVACGSAHTVCVDREGKVRSFGQNDKGQLGLGRREQNMKFFSPQEITGIPVIEAVACGDRYTILIDINGHVWACGDNSHAHLGLNNYYKQFSPVKIPNLSHIVSVSCGKSHTICIDESGSLWSFGRNDFGQLGLSHRRDVGTPQNVPLLDDFTVIKISCGSLHSVILHEDGTVSSCGNNEFGQLAIGNQSRDNPVFTKISNIQDIIDISCGSYHSLFCTGKGAVYGAGANEKFQLGSQNFNFIITRELLELKDIEYVEASAYGSIFVDVERNLWILGDFDGRSCKYPTKTEYSRVNIVTSGGSTSIIQEGTGAIFTSGECGNGDIRPATDFIPANWLSSIIKAPNNTAKSAYKI